MMNAAIDVAAEQAGGFEDAEMLGDGGKGHGEWRSKTFNGGFSLREACQDSATGGIGEGPKGGVESGDGIVNHTVYYCTGEAACQAIFARPGWGKEAGM